MEWMTKFVFKLILFVVVVLIVLSFVRQVFSPVDKTYVMAGKGQLPEPMPAAGIGTVNAKEASPSVIPAPPVPPVTGIPTSPPPTSGASPSSSPSVSPAGSLPVPPDPGKPILEAVHDQMLYRLLDAKAQGNRLIIRLQVFNKDTDRLIEITSLPWSKTLFYNERGEAYRPTDVHIANTKANSGKTRSMVVSGVPAEVMLLYSELPMVRGTLSFRQIALLQLDVAIFSTDQAYRNAFWDPIAISRPVFRNISIQETSLSSENGR
jgi:hypothetical protein